MSVEVINEQGGGGPRDANLFTDTMLAPDQPFLVGDQWQWNLEPNDATGYSGQNIAGGLNRNVNGLGVTNPTGGNTLPKGFGIPRPLSWTRVQGKSQFAEYVVFSDNSVPASVTRMGPMVLCNPNIGTCYWIELVVETGPFLLNISRWANGAGTNIAQIAANGFAIGDRITLTADIAAATVHLAYLRNGVSTLTVDDNTFRTGMPGFHVSGCSSGRTQVFNTFRCGALARL